MSFVGRQSFEDYLQTYRQIDVALDPFPFNGGTTTCDVLWMGVPVVCLSGEWAGARQGHAILDALGLPTEDKPASPCLSSRLAYGVRVTPERLGRVDRAETGGRARTNPRDHATEVIGTAGIAAQAHHLEQPTGTQLRILGQGFTDERQVINSLQDRNDARWEGSTGREPVLRGALAE